MNPSLYIHIPLCRSKCDYCDFFSIPVSGSDDSAAIQDRLTDALISEIALRKKETGTQAWATLYIGGGTPSLLSADNLTRIVRSAFPVTGEATIEANPGDISAQWLEATAAAGINRLSLGIQSLSDTVLSASGRRGSRTESLRALELVQKKWSGDLSLDLIAGLPGQNTTILEADIACLLSFRPEHISLYTLTVEDGTPLSRRLTEAGAGETLIPDQDEAARIWEHGRKCLIASRYRHYEISNFAQPGKESQHNLVYWNLESYAGAGPGATGTLVSGDHALRYTNRRDIEAYIKAPGSVMDTENIGRRDFIIETLMMGTRLLSGLDRKHFQSRFDQDILELIGATARRWEKRGLLLIDESRLALTPAGILFHNRFLEECLEEPCLTAQPAD